MYNKEVLTKKKQFTRGIFQQEYFFINPQVGALITNISHIIFHQHYPIQIFIALTEPVIITSNKKTEQYKSCIIKSNAYHKMFTSSMYLSLHIEPMGKLGQYLLSNFNIDNIDHFENKWTKRLRTIALAFLNKEISIDDFTSEYQQSIRDFINPAKSINLIDDRIEETINYLYKYAGENISIEEISEKVHLSPSRLLHLFKHNTGINYRGMQLWIKTKLTIFLWSETQSITSLSNGAGFFDSAHFNKTFKGTFGIKPQQIFKNTCFIMIPEVY